MKDTQVEHRRPSRRRSPPAGRAADPLAAILAAAATVEPDPLIRDWLAALAGPDAEGASSFDRTTAAGRKSRAAEAERN